MCNILLQPVDVSNNYHLELLYKLLGQRTHSISHAQMPNWNSHVDFCVKNPYRNWYFVYLSRLAIGSIYVTIHNSLGINLLDRYCTSSVVNAILTELLGMIAPLPPIATVRPPDFFVNVPISNIFLAQAMEELNFALTSQTFRIVFR